MPAPNTSTGKTPALWPLTVTPASAIVHPQNREKASAISTLKSGITQKIGERQIRISSTNTSAPVASSSVPLIEANTLTASREKPAGPVTLTVRPRARSGVIRLSTPLTDDFRSVSLPRGLRLTITSAVVRSGETRTGSCREPVTGGLAASEARVRSIAARSRGVSPPSRRTTVIAAKRSPDGKRLANVSSRTDSDEPGRNEDSSFFCTSWKRCANEPLSPPRMSHTTMIPMRARREPKRHSRTLMWAQARGLLRRHAGALGRS